jgi:hypothetical protein
MDALGGETEKARSGAHRSGSTRLGRNSERQCRSGWGPQPSDRGLSGDHQAAQPHHRSARITRSYPYSRVPTHLKSMWCDPKPRYARCRGWLCPERSRRISYFPGRKRCVMRHRGEGIPERGNHSSILPTVCCRRPVLPKFGKTQPPSGKRVCSWRLTAARFNEIGCDARPRSKESGVKRLVGKARSCHRTNIQQKAACTAKSMTWSRSTLRGRS